MIEVGSVLADRYELRERLGAGGMGEVYRAFDRELERDVAIKSLLSHLASDEQLVHRFRREARTLARVRHPGIIALYDMLRVSEDERYLVLEFVPGRSLEQELERGPLAWGRCADLGAQVCGALAAAHAQDVIHRDIKPSNILIEPSGLVRVADFGIARLAGASQMTRAGASMGTPGYWAPEQALGKASTAQTDIYSLGVVLFTAATGRAAFVAEEEGPASAFLNVTLPVPDPREVAPELPDAAAELIMRALAKEPAERFGSAVEMARALRTSAGLSPTPVTPLETLHPDLPPAFPTTPAPDPPSPAAASPPPPPPATPAGTGEAGATVAPRTPPPVAPASSPPLGAAPATTPSPRAATPPPDPALAPPEPEPEPEPAGAGAGAGATVLTPAGGRDTTTAPRAAPRRGARVAGVAVVLALAAAAGGFLTGRGGEAPAPDPPPEPVGIERVRAGAGSLEIPADWTSDTGTGLPDLPFEGIREASPPSPGEGLLIVGASAATGPTLLPAPFRERLGDDAPEAERVLLGELEALRYPGLAVDGVEDPVTLLVVPTDEGAQMVACVGADADFLARCEGAATTLRLSGVGAVPVGPDADYAELLAGTLAELRATAGPLRARLADAPTPAGQATFAAGLADAHAAAAAALDGERLGPRAGGRERAVVAALRDGAAAHRALASAARADNRAGFDAARADAAAAARALGAALAALRPLGYVIEG